MPKPRVGKTVYTTTIQEARDELGLMNVLLQRMLENQSTTVDRNRLIAQMSLAAGRIELRLATLEEIGRRYE